MELYLRISNVEIRNQTLMKFYFQTQILWVTRHLDYTVIPSITNTSHDKPTNRLKHTVIVASVLPLLLRKMAH